MAYPSCSRHVVLDVLQLSSTKGIETNVFFFYLLFWLSFFLFLSRRRCIRKGYCRLNPVVTDVVGVAVVGPVVAVHPEMSIVWTAMLGSRQ